MLRANRRSVPIAIRVACDYVSAGQMPFLRFSYLLNAQL